MPGGFFVSAYQCDQMPNHEAAINMRAMASAGCTRGQKLSQNNAALAAQRVRPIRLMREAMFFVLGAGD